jgi:hypothetical protein
LDPYFRTVNGFIVLIEKEWLSFGHQFALRNGIYTKEPSEDQRAPIFLQFLDCVHQLIIQFPNAFEYNLEFIQFIALNYNTNLYGTFMYNCESERVEKQAKEKTLSIWTDLINHNLNVYINPFYTEDKATHHVLKPNCLTYKLRFWEEYFLKWNVAIDQNLNPSKIFLIFHIGKSTHNFYLYNKMQDNMNLELLSSKIEDLQRALQEVYSKTQRKSIYKEFSDKTKQLMSHDIKTSEFQKKDEKNGDKLNIEYLDI